MKGDVSRCEECTSLPKSRLITGSNESLIELESGAAVATNDSQDDAMFN